MRRNKRSSIQIKQFAVIPHLVETDYSFGHFSHFAVCQIIVHRKPKQSAADIVSHREIQFGQAESFRER